MNKSSGRQLFVILCAGLFMTGCTHSEEPPAESIDVTAYSEQDGAPPPPDIMVEEDIVFTEPPAQPAVPSNDLAAMVNSVSDGRVDIYDISQEEEPAPVSGGDSMSSENNTSPVPQAPRGVVNNLYPNVEVFPLDGEMRGAMSSNLPPATAAQQDEMPAIDVGPAPIVLRPPGENSAMESDQDMMPMPGHQDEAAPLKLQPPQHDAQNQTPAMARSGEPRVYFSHDSASLNSEASQVVSGVVQEYKAEGGMPLSVEGHASVRSNIEDPVQRQIVNLKVSMDRAFAVAKDLMESGVPAQSIRTVGWGEIAPAAPADGRDAEAAARRVEIVSPSGR